MYRSPDHYCNLFFSDFTSIIYHLSHINNILILGDFHFFSNEIHHTKFKNHYSSQIITSTWSFFYWKFPYYSLSYNYSKNYFIQILKKITTKYRIYSFLLHLQLPIQTNNILTINKNSSCLNSELKWIKHII